MTYWECVVCGEVIHEDNIMVESKYYCSWECVEKAGYNLDTVENESNY